MSPVRLPDGSSLLRPGRGRLAWPRPSALDDVDVIHLLWGQKIGDQVHGPLLGLLGVEGMTVTKQATAQPGTPHEAVAQVMDLAPEAVIRMVGVSPMGIPSGRCGCLEPLLAQDPEISQRPPRHPSRARRQPGARGKVPALHLLRLEGVDNSGV